MNRRLGLSIFGLCAVIFVAWGFYAASQLVDERRELLLASREWELDGVAGTLASMVRNRAYDIREDLAVATDLIARAEAAGGESERLIVETHFAALDRSTRHYLHVFWFDEDGIILAASGNRSGIDVPPMEADEVAQLIEEAYEESGEVVSIASLEETTTYENLQLFGLVRSSAKTGVGLMVAMDALFDSLHKRAHLPGTQLWVMDGHGDLLVDPEATDMVQNEAVELLRSDLSEGTMVLGELPSLWPFSSRGQDSHFFAWRSLDGPSLRWSVGVGVQLDDVAGSVRELGMLLIGVGFIALAGVLATIWLLWMQQRRQERLGETIANLEKLQALRSQLIRAERLATLGQLAANVAHEIGTPLGVIAIRLDHMQRTASAKDSKYIEIMKEQIDRITRIMRGVLDFARPNLPAPDFVDLRLAVERVTTLLEHQRKGTSITIDIPDGLRVYADHDQVHQVLLNVMVNALDACAQVSAGKVHITASEDPPDVVLEVADNGVGIAASDIHRVYEPFYSTKAEHGGTGLGLSIVKDIMEAHRGGIEICALAQGVRVRIRWPAEGKAKS